MLKIFNNKDANMAYDSETGALFFLDALAAAVMQLYLDKNGEQPDQADLQQLADRCAGNMAELQDINTQLAQLKSEGVILREAEDIPLEKLYPDEPKLKAMCLHLCHDCNLRCRYCFAGTGDYGSGQRCMLSLETGKKAVDFLIAESGSRRNLDIDFFGGEPLMNWSVVKDLVAYCEEVGPQNNKQIRLTMTTNGLLLDDDKIDFINKHFKNVVLSLDGRKELNDLMRPLVGGKSSYDIIVPKLQRMVEVRGQGEHYVRGTFTAHNLDFADDVMHLYELGFRQISLEPVVADPQEAYALKEEHLEKIFSEYDRLADIFLEYARQGKGFHFFHFNVDLEGGPCRFKRMKGCGLGSEYCAVTPEGDIYPCHQLVSAPEMCMGNVATGFKSNLPAGLQDIYKKLVVVNKESCKACWARYLCSGGCPANAYHATGDLEGVDEFYCKIQRKRLETALRIQAKLRDL